VNEEAPVASPRILRQLTFALTAAMLAGCGGAASSGGAATDSFPLTLSTTQGKVTIPHRPTRIVSLSPTATEDLYAVGAGPRVVAVDPYSTYPAEAPRTALSGFTPNLEAIAGYKPDLVVVSDDANSIAGQLAKIGIPVLVEPAASDLNGAYSQINQIARATGHPDKGPAVVSGIQRKVLAILRSEARSRRPISVYHELDQTYYSATTRTFIGQMYKLLGLQNIADRAPGTNDYPQLSAEYIVSSNPDLIVLADTECCNQNLATVQQRPGWSAIKAVKTGSVVPVRDEIASRWGPRIVLFLQAVADKLKALVAAIG
jgi:iron complex transport system substrate-binding protein